MENINISRRKSIRLSKLDERLQTIEHEGSPSSRHPGHSVAQTVGKAPQPTKSSFTRDKETYETPVVSLGIFSRHLGLGLTLFTGTQEPKTYRTLHTQSITPYTRPTSSASARLRHRPFLDPSSPLYESPYRSRQGLKISTFSGKRTFGKPDSSSPLMERRQKLLRPPRLDIANPLYTLRPHGEMGSDQAPWMQRRKARCSKALKESGL